MTEIFGVSRASLREARCGAGPGSGYVVIAPARGNEFADLLQVQSALLGIRLWDLLEIREVVEAMTVRLAGQFSTSGGPRCTAGSLR